MIDRLSPILLRLAASLALALPAVGCAPARLVNALVPDDGYRLIQDRAYGAGPRQRLDVYVPDDLTAPAPVVVFFYGGRWEFGVKEDYRFVGQALASQGLIAVIADYRLYPEVRFPTFIEDGAAAVRWVQAQISGLGGDPARIFVMGHSAGAHIAAMLALDAQYLNAVGTTPRALAGLIGLAGPYDFLPLTDPTLQRIFAAEDMAETQPITFAGDGGPPALLLHGEQDRTVRPANSTHLAAQLRAAGTPVELGLYPDLGHIGIVGALAAPLRWQAPVLDDVARFVRERADDRPGA